MPDFRDIPVDLLVPPDRPMRTESLTEGLSELKESMALHGLQQPIGVRLLEDSTYQIIWGMRRSLAAKELGWRTIPARVYAMSEGDVDMLMAHENFHRTQLDPVEEAEFFRDLMQKNNIGPAEVARRCRRSVTHVHIALDLLEGDPKVLQALREGRINKGQAQELNLTQDELGRHLMLGYCLENGISVRYLKRWREEREANGTSQSMEDVQTALASVPTSEMRSQIKCDIHNDWVPMSSAIFRQVCQECWNTVSLVADHYATCPVVQGEKNPVS